MNKIKIHNKLKIVKIRVKTKLNNDMIPYLNPFPDQVHLVLQYRDREQINKIISKNTIIKIRKKIKNKGMIPRKVAVIILVNQDHDHAIKKNKIKKKIQNESFIN
jgi:hypothetical protein